MNSSTFVGSAARRKHPMALIIAPTLGRTDYRGLALREFDAEMTTAEIALTEPGALAGCALLLADTNGLTENSAALLIELAAAHRQNGSEVILVCSNAHVDFLGAILGSGAALLCEPQSEEIEQALQNAFDAIQRQQAWRNRSTQLAKSGPFPAFLRPWPTGETQPPRPYWLDIVSDQLTDLAIAQQAASPESPAIAQLLDRMIGQLLALIPDRALIDAVASTSANEDTAEFERLGVELERRGLTVPSLTCPEN